MRGRGYTRLKGKQIQISLYLQPPQYWLLRAACKKTGFSMQYLLRRALHHVLRDVDKDDLVGAGLKHRPSHSVS